ncbi:SNAP receptor use1 [Borealophlyctis nickersoniae]|nr:SNAP receptor use1 [Borealophlyctis nickersoniae]
MSAMDMSPAAVIGTNYCGLLMTLTVFGSCLPSFLAIKDIQLKVSIAFFFLCFIMAVITNGLGWHALLQGDLVNFGRGTITGSIFFTTAFVSQSFYSIRRTCMIYNLSPRVQLYLPIFMTISQCAIQYALAGYWSTDMLKYYGAKYSPETAELSITSIVWMLGTEPVCFALLQYKIVQSATSFQRANNKRLVKTVLLWVEAAMRLTLYIFTVLFCYMAVSDFLRPSQLAYWSMISVLPASVGLIFLTDVARFQKALGKSVDGTAKATNAQSFRTELVEAGGATTKGGASTLGVHQKSKSEVSEEEEEAAEANLKHLRKLLQEVEADPARKIDDTALCEYRRRVDQLGDILDEGKLLSSVNRTFSTLRNAVIIPGQSSTEKIAEVDRVLKMQRKAEDELRGELMKKSDEVVKDVPSTPRRTISLKDAKEELFSSPLAQRNRDLRRRPNRIDGDSESFESSLNPQSSDPDTQLVLDQNRKLQDQLTDDLIRMAAVLKGNSLLMGDVLKKDAKVVEETSATLQTNATRIKKEGSRLSALNMSARNTTWMVWLTVLFVCIVFAITFMFMRVVRVR